TAATESIAIREVPAYEVSAACLACGWCVDVCPTALTPVRLMELSQKIPDTTLPSAPTPPAPLPPPPPESPHCIACRLCSYVRPSRLPLPPETLRLRALVERAPSEAQCPPLSTSKTLLRAPPHSSSGPSHAASSTAPSATPSSHRSPGPLSSSASAPS